MQYAYMLSLKSIKEPIEWYRKMIIWKGTTVLETWNLGLDITFITNNYEIMRVIMW